MCPQIPFLDLKNMDTGGGGRGHYALRHHVPRGWGPQGNCKEGRSQIEWGGAARGRGRERRGHEAGRGQRGVGGASAIQPVQAAAGGSACRVPSTLGSESVTGTTGSDQRQTRGRAEAGGTESGGRSPSSKGGKYPGSGKPREQRGVASFTQGAAATVTGRGARARDPGWDSKQAAQAPPPFGPPHLRATLRRLRPYRQHLRRPAHRSPPLDRRRQARAAHLDSGLREPRLLGCGVFATARGGCRWSGRGCVEPGAGRLSRSRPGRRRVPGTGLSAPAPGEKPPPAGHHEQQQRQHHLRQSQAAEAGTENVSVWCASSARGWALRRAGAGGRLTRAHIPAAW